MLNEYLKEEIFTLKKRNFGSIAFLEECFITHNLLL